MAHGTSFTTRFDFDEVALQRHGRAEDYISGERPPSEGIFGWRIAQDARHHDIPESALALDIIQRLARKMALDGLKTGAETQNRDIPAGYTYFGQLVAHDMIFNETSTIDILPQTGERVWTTPQLDLDCIYRGGPARSPQLFQVSPASADDGKDRIYLRVGLTAGKGYSRPDGSSDHPSTSDQPEPFDLAAFAFDTTTSNAVDSRPRPDIGAMRCPAETLIGDPRNDDNLTISQITALFHRFHNKICDVLSSLPNGPEGRNIYRTARALVTDAYRTTIESDYLHRLIDTRVWQSHAQSGPSRAKGPFGRRIAENAEIPMPMEFWLAAMRIGHAMIQPVYVINATQPQPSGLRAMLNFRSAAALNRGTIPGRPVSNDWLVDLRNFFPGPDEQVVNPSRLIRPAMAMPLYSFRALEPGGDLGVEPIFDRYGGLPFRDLARGYLRGMPNGQHLAELYDVPALDRDELIGDAGEGLAGMYGASAVNPLNDAPIDAITALAEDTPLLYYLLREAEIRQNGKRLGPLGSRILADVIFSLFERKPASNDQLGFWQSLIFGPAGPPATMREIIDFTAAPDGASRSARPASQASV